MGASSDLVQIIVIIQWLLVLFLHLIVGHLNQPLEGLLHAVTVTKCICTHQQVVAGLQMWNTSIRQEIIVYMHTSTSEC